MSDPAVQTPIAGSGAAAAMELLRARGQVAGASFVVPGDLSPINTFAAMRDALIAQHGRITGASSPYPAGLTYVQLIDWCDAWSAAGVAAMTAAPQLFGFLSDNSISDELGEIDAWRNICAFYGGLGGNWADGGGGIVAEDDDIEQAIDRAMRLAAALESADFLTPDARPADWTWSEVPGTIAGAALSGISTVLGGGAEAVAGALLGSPYVWAAGLAYFAWRFAR